MLRLRMVGVRVGVSGRLSIGRTAGLEQAVVRIARSSLQTAARKKRTPYVSEEPDMLFAPDTCLDKEPTAH